jgi:sulfur carrier protein
VKVTLNGVAREVPAGTTVAGLLALAAVDARRIAVERNLEVVPRALHGVTPLAEGDRVEVVTMVGGG